MMRGMLGSAVGRWSGPTSRPPREIALLQHTEPQGSHAGNSSVGAYSPYALNRIRHDPFGLVAQLFSNGEFMLRPGRYLARARAVCMNTGGTETRVYDVSRGVVLVDGDSTYGGGTGDGYSTSSLHLMGEFTLNRQTRVAYQLASAANESSWGQGHAGSVNTEVFSWLWLRRWDR